MGTIVPILALLSAAGAAEPATPASGRHWQLAIERLECEASRLTLRARLRYLGREGPVEAPVNRLVDAKGKPYPPRSLVWHGGSKEIAQWLPRGGVRIVPAQAAAAVQLSYEVQGAEGELHLEFGDIRAFALTQKGACMAAEKLRGPKAARLRAGKVPDFRIYRARYPCLSPGGVDTLEAQYPPHLPRQLLVFGRGYLPNARQVDLPMGAAPAQSYAYVGVDSLDAVDAAARQAAGEDFPAYVTGPRAPRTFAFNWGVQKTASGNDAYAIGFYDLRRCP
jgi:hypothetical protein